MNTTINERMGFLIEKKAKSQSDFARKIGKPSQTIASIVNGRNEPSSDVLRAIKLNFPNVNLDWILIGEGNFEKDSESIQNVEARLVEALERERNVLLKNINDLEKDKERLWIMLETIGKKLEANKWTRVVKLDLQHFKKQA